jgi:DUF4097 and DUF4098 domain-containing protein YvlB
VSGGVLRLGEGCDDGWAIFRCITDYRIEVPRELAVEIDTEAGDVSVSGVGGSVTIDADVGDVDATALAAATVKATSDAGDVRLSFATAPTSLVADSGAGDVELVLPRGEYAVETESDAGDTSVSGLIRYDLAPHSVEASSDAGDVTIRGR